MIMKKLFSLLVLSLCVVAVMATDRKEPEKIDTLLEQFDHKPGLKTIAGTLLAAGNPEEAEGYSLRAITYAKKANNPSRMAVIYGMASEIENRLEHKEQARIMLLQDLDIPIVEVGNCCGFEDHSSFTRTFTQNVGMSPSDYRLNRGKS